jgi:hypothetical protein
VTVVPGALWASVQARLSPGHHIERSTTMGVPLVDSTTIDTAVSARAGASWSTQIV